MNHMSAENREAGIYIVDQNNKIIYMNDMAKIYYPDLKSGMSPSSECLKMDHTSVPAIFYNTASNQWMIISSADIDWPGYKGCRLILSQSVNEKNKNLFFNLIDTSIHKELFELNLSANTYKILFHQKEKYKELELEGNMGSLCMKAAYSMVYPDDRERFLEFCDIHTLLSRLYANSNVIKGDFRIKQKSGEYCWISFILVLFEAPIAMCYIQNIDTQKKAEEEEQKRLQKKKEEKDSLTGLFRYGHFLYETEKLLKKQPDTLYFMVAIDIEHFKLFNEWYGEELGDRLLVKIAAKLSSLEHSCHSVAGYMGGDDFAIVIPADFSILKTLELEIGEYVRLFGENAGFLPVFGVYRIEDRSFPVSLMYDRAAIALNSVKGNYTNRVGWYDPNMKLKMENDQVLLAEIQRGLEKQEFIFYVQPQCNMLTGKIIGMESLVRWQHPVRGLVSPEEFIPILERTGFITYLDMYMWEKVCQNLSNWMKSGKRPIPISVNMSRMDIYAIDVVEKFKNLVLEYDIDSKYLEIEITESAYAEDTDLLRKVIEDLRRAGFQIFMDDFGSGYSSLNMLKDIHIDVLKIDTKFLDMNENSKCRGMDILETIVRLAKVMQLKIIAEGVEKKEQADFLINTGCIYGQGYYFFKPVPVAEIHKLLSDEDNVDFQGIQARQMRILKLEDIFNENIANQVRLNHILGAIALYDVYEDQCEFLRANEEYYCITGDNPVDTEQSRRFVLNKIYKDDKEWFLNIFNMAYNNPLQGAEGMFRRYRVNGELIWLNLRVFFLREQDGHCFYYGSVQDATRQMEQRQKLEDSQKMLGEVLSIAEKIFSFENIAKEDHWAASAMIAQAAPGGLFGFYCEKGLPLYFINDEMLRLLEYDSYKSFANEIGWKLTNIIHPEELKVLQEKDFSGIFPGMVYSLQYRLRKQDGEWLRLLSKGRIVEAENGRLAMINSCMEMTDETL